MTRRGGSPRVLPRPRRGQSIRDYAREHGVSYRQARQLAFRKTPYERTPRGRAYRESAKTREASAIKAWRATYFDDPRTDAELLRDWKRLGWGIPQHGGKQQPVPVERARRAFVEQGLGRPYSDAEYRAIYQGAHL